METRLSMRSLAACGGVSGGSVPAAAAVAVPNHDGAGACLDARASARVDQHAIPPAKWPLARARAREQGRGRTNVIGVGTVRKDAQEVQPGLVLGGCELTYAARSVR